MTLWKEEDRGDKKEGAALKGRREMNNHAGIRPGRMYFPAGWRGWDSQEISLAYWLEHCRAPSIHMVRRQERAALSRTDTATNNVAKEGAAKQETTKETHNLLPRPALYLKKTGLTAYNTAIARKRAEMGLNRPITEAVAPTDLAGPCQIFYVVT